MRRLLAAMLMIVSAAPAMARPALTLEKVVLVYRHGVRAPLETEAALDAVPNAPLPRWPVAESLLTDHGALALERVGAWRRNRFIAAALWPRSGCPFPADLAIWTNTAARTIASGEALARGMAPGCTVAIGHLAAGRTDPVFEPMGLGLIPFDGAAAVRSIDAYTGGLPALTARHAGELRLLARVIGCDRAPRPCDLAADSGAIGSDGRDIALTGAIRRYSGTAQVLMLEYLEGMERRDVGWGRASPADLRRLGSLHSALFDVYTRPPYMAARVAGPLLRRIAAVLTDPDAARVTAFVGHDSNISALAALLGVSVAAPGYAPGDPPPGGALIFELLRDDADGRWIRLRFEAAKPRQIRHLSTLSPADPPGRQILRLAGCGGGLPARDVCPLSRLMAIAAVRAVAN